MSCPATSGHDSVSAAVKDLLLAIMKSLNGKKVHWDLLGRIGRGQGGEGGGERGRGRKGSKSLRIIQSILLYFISIY